MLQCCWPTLLLANRLQLHYLSIARNSLGHTAGNSGGPLLDSSGRVIGVNTATFTRVGSGQSSGVNFALPIDMVRDVVPKLIVFGTSSDKRVWMRTDMVDDECEHWHHGPRA
jgi:S1-C subfamily serine protease